MLSFVNISVPYFAIASIIVSKLPSLFALISNLKKASRLIALAEALTKSIVLLIGFVYNSASIVCF